MANLKMEGSGLVPCPEVEQLRPCVFFGEGRKVGKCPDCYAEPALKLRLSTSRKRRETPGHKHTGTEAHGAIRLGTFREILPADWQTFKAGQGTWDCCGAEWDRPDFRTRPYFLITRGLSPTSFYEQVAADPACINIQVSVDLWPTGELIPHEEKLAEFVRIPKLIFRAKTTPENAGLWGPLFDRLAVASGRVMETVLRSRVLETKLLEGHFAYGRKTLLEKAGWDWHSFLRCNTACRDCVKENGVLACVVRPATTERLIQLRRAEPPRHNFALHDISWAHESRRALSELGGEATVQELYRWWEQAHPELVVGKPSWQFKVRVAIQRVAVRTDDGKGWRLPVSPLEAWASPKAEAEG